MKKIISTVVCMAFSIILFAQEIEVNKKTGLVQVDGKDAFYLIGKNKVLGVGDFSLQNLNNEELAYLKAFQGQYYNDAARAWANQMQYAVTFSESGNTCILKDFTSLSIIKSVAKSIVAAGLIKDNQISFEAEKKFILIHGGEFFKERENANKDNKQNIVVNVNSDNNTSNNKAPNIVVKDNKIYNHDELIGTFKLSQSGNNSVYNIYNANGEKICTASHENNNDNADWDLSTSEKKTQIMYNAAQPLEKLFTYLVDKAILK